MSNQIIEDPDFIKLQFSQEWIDVGILNTENFELIKQEYLKGEDERTEHYRWGAFKSFMQLGNFLSLQEFYNLYEIGKNDPDYAMGRSIIFDIVQHPYCPEELIELITNDNDITLAKHALKYKSLRKTKEV
jgi:hypothetical protein